MFRKWKNEGSWQHGDLGELDFALLAFAVVLSIQYACQRAATRSTEVWTHLSTLQRQAQVVVQASFKMFGSTLGRAVSPWMTSSQSGSDSLSIEKHLSRKVNHCRFWKVNEREVWSASAKLCRATIGGWRLAALGSKPGVAYWTCSVLYLRFSILSHHWRQLSNLRSSIRVHLRKSASQLAWRCYYFQFFLIFKPSFVEGS